ncbi:MAG: hypothetical protein J6I65_00175 [Lachnospiraceae bacterium]|nr:hypothetical protein [Lachnospiraceae bacterium]
MKKRLLSAALIICMTVMLTGCMEMKVEDKVSKEGSCTETVNTYINKQEYMNYMLEMAKEIGGDTSVISPDYIDREMAKEGYQVTVIDGKEYYSDPKEAESKVCSLPQFYIKNQSFAAKGGYQLYEAGLSMNLKDASKELETELKSSAKELKSISKDSTKLLKSCYLVYSVEFDYDITSADKNAVIEREVNPRKATWKISFDKLANMRIWATCNSTIKVKGVTQGSSYKKAVKLNFSGAESATYKGKKISNNKKFSNHGQHSIVLKAANGEQRTVVFFIDKKKPVISKLKNKKTYKGTKTFKVTDKDSGIASVKINGKTAKEVGSGTETKKSYKLSKKGTNRIVVKDKAGNVKKMTVKLK